jgi:excisionase family DNA binding protein
VFLLFHLKLRATKAYIIGKWERSMSALAEKPDDTGLMERPPTPEEIDSAAHAATAIAVAMELDSGLKISGENGVPVKIAPAVGELIIELLGHVSNGNMVTLVPVGTMLTTQQAADMLNVSRPHLTKLLKEGRIKFEEVGKHRRVPLKALMNYRDDKVRRQEAALDELARLGQEFDNG